LCNNSSDPVLRSKAYRVADFDVAAFVSLFAPTAIGDTRRAALKVRERQFKAAFDRKKSLEIAKAIVARKVKAEGHRREVGQAFLTGCKRRRQRTMFAISRHKPRKSFGGNGRGSRCGLLGLAWPLTGIRGPAGTIGRRQGKLGELALQFTARGAVHPMQAMLNFSMAIVTARMTRAIVAVGLDPCFGFLHDGRKPGRLSLVWDCVEPLRPKLIRAVFGYVAAHEFEKRDFLIFVHKITAERTVRLAPPLAKEIAALAVNTVSVRECVKVVRWLVSVIK
jgi:CRISPR/Cas system-associated endonuclease Cas1